MICDMAAPYPGVLGRVFGSADQLAQPPDGGIEARRHGGRDLLQPRVLAPRRLQGLAQGAVVAARLRGLLGTRYHELLQAVDRHLQAVAGFLQSGHRAFRPARSAARKSRGRQRIGAGFATGQPPNPPREPLMALSSGAPPRSVKIRQNRAICRLTSAGRGGMVPLEIGSQRRIFPFPVRWTFSMDVATSPSAQDSLVTPANHRDMANAIRALAMDAVQKANSGHPGMPMGMADVATVLFTRFLKFDPATPGWSDRDRFVLSAGHGSMLLYALLFLTGYEDMTLEELKNFRQFGSRTAGHPEFGHAAGIETTTGPLGQGLANAVGMALAERLLNARFGDGLVDHYTYCIAGDGCLMEGISHEAISLAGHLRLGKLIVLFDDNSISIDGSVDLACSDDQLKRFEACGWEATRVDGHDPDAVAKAIAAARKSDRPSLIACRTTIGYGAPNKQGTAATHGS